MISKKYYYEPPYQNFMFIMNHPTQFYVYFWLSGKVKAPFSMVTIGERLITLSYQDPMK